MPAFTPNLAVKWSSPFVRFPAVLYVRFVKGDSVLVKWNVDTGFTK